jgi:NAD(P)-dependent dehydrogenase (short-subunit alcohol dehydrogenase family)
VREMSSEKAAAVSVKNLFDLRDKVAIVTGGVSHLGYFISEALSEAGAEVFITSRNQKKCKEIARLLGDRVEGKVHGLVLNIDSLNSIVSCFDEVVNRCGKIDVLINNATINAGRQLESTPESEWLLGIDGTINGVFRTTKAVVPIMERNKSGSIINIASMYGTVSPDPTIYEGTQFCSSPSYGPGKSAIIQFTRYTACYLAKRGIRVNAVSPGPFPNPEVQKDRKFISRLKNKTPLGRIGQPYELKGVIVFLASGASSYVTGVNLPVDGGWTAW